MFSNSQKEISQKAKVLRMLEIRNPQKGYLPRWMKLAAIAEVSEEIVKERAEKAQALKKPQEERVYLNEFHKESTEKSLKALEEMRKSPVNYKEELERHTKMQETARKMEEDYLKTQEKLFNYFQTSSTRPTDGEQSTGLGLAISKQIVNLYKGEIDFRSDLNKGSNFYFTLPIKK